MARKRGENQPPANKGEQIFKAEAKLKRFAANVEQGNIGDLSTDADNPQSGASA